MWLSKRQLPLYLAIALAALVTGVLIVNGKPSHPHPTTHSSPAFDVRSALHFGKSGALSYTGAPLPGPPPVRVGPEGLSMEVPPSWRSWVVRTGSQPPSFLAASFLPGTPKLCARDGPLESLPVDGVVLYVSVFTSIPHRYPERPDHVILDPRTYGPYEGTGCHPGYSVRFKLREFAIAAEIYFGSDPSLLLKAQTLRALDSLRFVGG